MLVCRNKVTGIIDQISVEKAKANMGWWVLEEGEPLLLVAPGDLKVGENVWTPTELTQAEKDARTAEQLAVAKQAKALEITSASMAEIEAMPLSLGITEKIFNFQRFLKEQNSTQECYPAIVDVQILALGEANIIKAKQKYALIDEATTVAQVNAIVWA